VNAGSLIVAIVIRQQVEQEGVVEAELTDQHVTRCHAQDLSWRKLADHIGNIFAYTQLQHRCFAPDSQPCSPPACTVLNIAIGSAGRFASLLPGYRFPRSPDRCFKSAADYLPFGAGCS